MPTFEYQAKSGTGEFVNGVVFGSSIDQASRDLAARGLLVTRIGMASSINDPLAAMSAPPITNTSANPSATSPAEPPFAPTGYSPSGYAQAQNPYSSPTESSVAAKSEYQGVEYQGGQYQGGQYQGGQYREGQRQPQAPNGPPIDSRSYFETSVWGPLAGKVPLTDLNFFFKQLGTMLNSGVPVVQSLSTLAKQSPDKKLGEIVHEIQGHVEAGRPMTAGMQRYPEVFSPVMVSLTRAGEEGGFVGNSLLQISAYLEKEIALRTLYRRLTLMPKIQVFASIAIIVLANMIITSIRPDAQTLSSPLTTLSTWFVLGPLLIGGFLFVRIGLANPRIKYNWDFVGAHIPALGKMLRELATARFGRAFGALHKSGVPLTKSMLLASDACGNEYLRSLISPAAHRMEDGDGIAETFQNTNAFSPIVLDMIATGETTGNLEMMLEKMSDFYEEEATTKATQAATIVGFMLGLFVAAYIGYIVISFWSGYAGQVSGAG